MRYRLYVVDNVTFESTDIVLSVTEPINSFEEACAVAKANDKVKGNDPFVICFKETEQPERVI
jgi:hypothetical protein